MRLISQVAKEIWICDNKEIKRYEGDTTGYLQRRKDNEKTRKDKGKRGVSTSQKRIGVVAPTLHPFPTPNLIL